MTVPPQVPLCAIRQPAFLYGSDGRVAEANDLAEALAGRSLAGCSTAAVVGIFDVCLPDGTPLLPADLPAARALRGEETVDAPLLITAADDRTMHILATASPIRDGSGTVGALAVWQDVSFLEAALADQARLRLESEARGEELKTQEEELRRQRDELLRAGAENARQRHLLDTILGTIPYRVSLWSRDERLLWANERFAAERGLSRDRLIGRPYKEFGDREAVVGSLVDEARSAATDGIPVRRELVIPAPDGPGWRACTLLPFLEDALLVITEDITERRRGMEERERLLAESEEHRGRLQAIVESLPVGLWIADATGKMLFINDRAREIWGGDAPYATSVEGYGAYTAWWADTGERIAAEEMPVARALRGESSRELVIDFLRFDGTHGTQLVSAEPIRTADGTIIGGVAIVQDITERRRIKTALAESEAKYRNLVELAPDAIVILQDGAIVFANPAAAALVGAAAPEELVGRSALDLVPSTSRDRFAATMQADLRDGTSPTELTDLVRLDGTTVPVQGRGARLLFRGRPALQVVLRDISDLQRTERALLEREAWLQLAQEAAHVAVWDWDVRTDALRYSPEFLRFFGLDEDTLGEYRAWQEWVHPDDLAGWEAVRDTALANGEPFRGEFRVVHPSGEVRWLAAQGRGVYDDRGDLVHVVGVNIEITDRKQAAVELERLTRRVEVERDRLAAILDAIPDAVATHDRDGRYVYVNPALTGSIHADPGDFIGRTWAELGLDLERVALLVDAVEGAFASGEPQTGVYDYPIDGVLRTYHALAVPLRGAGGAVDQVIVSSRDITGIREAEKALQRYAADLESEIASRKQAEQAARMREQTLQTLLRAAPVGIGISEDRTIRRVNDYLCRMTGYAPEELVGRDARLLYTSDEEYVRVGEERVMQFLEHGTGVLETQWRRKDGTVIDIMFCSAPMDAASPRGAVVFVGLEITALREKEKALREYAENLERSNQDLERFAYVSSHDLQEPLRPMVSFSQLLQRRYRGRLDADADEYLDFIVEGGVRMQSLIQDLLAYSRVNTTKPAMAPTDPAAVLASVERSLAVPLCEAGATITYDPMPMVLADPLQLEQVFANLISNAIKFRRPDEPLRIHVGARRTDGSCEFSVADNGIGIEPEYFEKIFVIFQRLHTKDAYPGTGIGLAIVKRIIDRHGGRVWLESVPGEGSAFFFTLPAA